MQEIFFRLKAEAEQQRKEEDKARREYIRNEYLRKKQLKLMVDMDEVIKPRSGSLKKKPRPKSIHRDVMESSTPAFKAGEQHATNTHYVYSAVPDLPWPLLLLGCRGTSSRLLGIKCFFSVSQSCWQWPRPTEQQEEQQVRATLYPQLTVKLLMCTVPWKTHCSCQVVDWMFLPF